MSLQENKQLFRFNTFKISAMASYYWRIYCVEDLFEALEWYKNKKFPLYILGGGSNLLLTDDLDGLVIHMQTKGIQFETVDDNSFLLTANAGEAWQDVVQYAVENNLGGIENLSAIPGCIGAAPVQNVGAYGAEFKDVCEYVTALYLPDMKIHTIPCSECDFGYRSSKFKNEAGDWIVLSVAMRLHANSVLNLEYGSIKDETTEVLQKSHKTYLDYSVVAKAVRITRNKKLPDPDDNSSPGSAGSFFKNPTVSKGQVSKLQKTFTDIPFYPQAGDKCKLSAAWLLDKAGWKGKRIGSIGCYEQQPLVIVNYNDATGVEVQKFASLLQKDVFEKFDVLLEPEVVYWP